MNENFENLIMDIQRSDIPHIKSTLINYLKFATARSEKSRQLEEQLKDISEKEIEVLTNEVEFFLLENV